MTNRRRGINQVMELIRGERAYQDAKFGEEHDEERTVADWLLDIDHLLLEAKERLYYDMQDVAMEQIRKIAAVCVAAMEYIDTPAREE
jgi:hypothetical protein